MIDPNTIVRQVSEFGFAKLPNFLNYDEIEASLNMVKGKIKGTDSGQYGQYIPHNLKIILIKFLKLDFVRLKQGLEIRNMIRKRPQLKQISDGIFKCKSRLAFVDGYCLKRDKEIFWHSDGVLLKSLKTDKLLILIYLTKVSQNNGCMGYISKSHKIIKQIKKGLIEKKINIENKNRENLPLGGNFSFDYLKKLILDRKNYEYLKENLEDKKNLDNFITKIDSIGKNSNLDDAASEMNAGDAIIFDQSGIHGGTKSTLNERLILRFHFMKI